MAGKRGVRFFYKATMGLCLFVFATLLLLLHHNSERWWGSAVDNFKGRARESSERGGQAWNGKDVKVYGYRVVREIRHDPQAFTQGLLFHNGHLYESTGNVQSGTSVRILSPSNGEVVNIFNVGGDDDDVTRGTHFGEGLAISEEKLVQLTWRSPIGFEYGAETLQPLRQFTTELKDGWGLVALPERGQLAATDSSNIMSFLEPSTYRTLSQVTINDAGKSVAWLNELEVVDGDIWGNIWQTDCIAMVDVQVEPGKVKGWIDMTGLKGRLDMGEQQGIRPDVLNGIAWDKNGQRIFVTGKLWSKMFEIEVYEKQARDSETLLSNVRKKCIIKES